MCWNWSATVVKFTLAGAFNFGRCVGWVLYLGRNVDQLFGFFSHITTVSGCDRELNAHFYCAASLKYHAPDTWHDTTPSHIILTLCRPVLALLCKSECQARSSLYQFLRLSYVAAQDRTLDLLFPGVDTLPTELSGSVSAWSLVMCVGWVRYLGRNVDRLQSLSSTSVSVFGLVGVSADFGMLIGCGH